ncbi:MAG: cupin domain-containing protein [Desulfobacterales bacterium]|nr:cupin domain-containing protein [Desulfobacterales bacterium]
MSHGQIINFKPENATLQNKGYKTNAVEGHPFESVWEYYNHPSGNFRAGVWECDAGAWTHNHPKTEFCYIVEGEVSIQEEGGPLHEYKAGDAFIVPMGTPVTWKVKHFCKKVFVGATQLDS